MRTHFTASINICICTYTAIPTHGMVLYFFNTIKTVTYTNLAANDETQVYILGSIPYLHYKPTPLHKELQWDDKTLLSPEGSSLDMLSVQRHQSETKTWTDPIQ